MAGTVLVSLCPWPGPGRCSWNGSVEGRQTDREGVHSTQRLMGKRRINHSDNYTTTKFFNVSHWETVCWNLLIVIKEIPRQTQQAHHWWSLLPSVFRTNPFRWSTETNPGHLSRSGFDLPLRDIVLVHHDPQHPILWVSSLWVSAQGWHLHKASAGMPHISTVLSPGKLLRPQASQPFVFLTSRSTHAVSWNNNHFTPVR